MAGPLTRTHAGWTGRITVVETKLFECPEALSAYQQIKAKAILQRRGYNLLGRSASAGKWKRRSRSSDLQIPTIHCFQQPL